MREKKQLTVSDYIDKLNASAIIYDAFSDSKTFSVTAYPYEDVKLKPLKFKANNELELLEELEYYYGIVNRREKKEKRKDILWSIGISYLFAQNILISLSILLGAAVILSFLIRSGMLFK